MNLPARLSQAASVVGGNPSVNAYWQSFVFLHRQSHLRKVLMLQTPEVVLLVVGEQPACRSAVLPFMAASLVEHLVAEQEIVRVNLALLA